MRPTKRGHRLSPRSEKGLVLAERNRAVPVLGERDTYAIYTKTWLVENDEGRTYVVGLDPLECDCPDWRYRGVKTQTACKHIIAAALQKSGC